MAIQSNGVVALADLLYLVVLPAAHSGEFSPFQGFSLNTFEVCDQINRICQLPATIDELFSTREEVIRLRVSGVSGYRIAQLEVEFLSQFAIGEVLVCIISDATTQRIVTQTSTSPMAN